MTTVNGGMRVPNPPRTCIFCGGRPIPKEHIYANWMEEFLAPGGYTNHYVSTYLPLVNGHSQTLRASKGPLTLKGDHRSRGLKVVCSACNNQRMSELQKIAKPALLPYLHGRPYLPNRQQQRAIAAWAVMFSMVFENADPPTAAIDQRQRSFFMKQKRAPPHWLVWVGSLTNGAGGPAHHRGLAFVDRAHGENTIPKQMNIQMTIGGAGNLLFVTASTSNERIADVCFRDLRATAAGLGFFRIWPTVGHAQPLPKVFHSGEIPALMNSMTDVFMKS